MGFFPLIEPSDETNTPSQELDLKLKRNYEPEAMKWFSNQILTHSNKQYSSIKCI